MVLATIWVNVKCIMLSERSQIQVDTQCFYLYDILEKAVV